MYAVEFQAPVENGIVHIPKNYQKMYEKKNVRVIILPEKQKEQKDIFDVKKYFGVTNENKTSIDNYLKEVREKWNDILDEK